VPNRIDVTAPATITVLAGSSIVSSLGVLPPGGISIGNAAGTIAVTLTAANAGAGLSASGLGGATVSGSGGTLTLAGTQAQVNAALATLEISESASSGTDTILLAATGASILAAQTAIAVNIAPAGGPAFVAPPATLSLHPDTLMPITGLLIGDPGAAALNAAGLGAEQTLALTLATGGGLLFLPGFTALDGISATGLGTGTIIIEFTADRLGAVNNLLTGLECAGFGGTSGLAYGLRNVAGPLGPAFTNGNIVLNVGGTGGPFGTSTAGGGQSLVWGPQSLSAGSTLTISGTTGAVGTISGAGAIVIAPDAALALPYSGINLGGSSLDFGTLSATTFAETGSIVIGDNAVFSGPILLGTAALLDFSGTLNGDSGALAANQLAISLAAGAVLTGDGLLLAGNFSESGRITGAGTILAGGGETLLIAAGSVGGGAALDVGAGGVMILGPVDPLYGVFDATPLTIDSSVTLGFGGQAGAAVIGGGFADTLDQSGGVFVLDGPQAFSGIVTGFAPGDRLIFPGLTNISLFDVSASGFEIVGQDSGGTSQTYMIQAAIPAGAQLHTGTDLAGDAEVSLRDSQIDVFLDGISAATAGILATQGVAQPVIGLQILPPSAPAGMLSVTLSAAFGLLSTATLSAANTLVVTAPNLSALNAALAELVYTGEGTNDTLALSAGGALAGIAVAIPINATPVGVVTGFGAGVSAGKVVQFPSASLVPVTQNAAPGELLVTGLTDFADIQQIGGFPAYAIVIDAGGTAIFDAASTIATSSDVLVGDAGGAGDLVILTDNFTVGSSSNPRNVTLGGAGAGSAADISGSLSVSGVVLVKAASLHLSGALNDSGTTIGPAGTFFGGANASAALGAVLDSGTLWLVGQTEATAATAETSGTLLLGGTALLEVAGLVRLDAGGQVTIGPDATLQAGTVTAAGGAILESGLLQFGSLISRATLTLEGGTLAGRAATLQAAGTLAGAGIVNTTTLTNAGSIIASGGALTLGGNIHNTGSIFIGNSASLDIVHGISGGAISFTGSNAELTINDAQSFASTIANMVGSDVVDLVGIAPSLVSFAAGSISVGTIGFTLGVAAGQPAVQIMSDNFGGALITLGGEMPCFARGTRLLTPNGYRPVEALNPGDPLITAAGDRRPVRWIGRRTLDLSAAASARPVIIAANALGPGMPLRAVRLSPLHGVFVDGVLVPVAHLVNGATIRQETARAAVTYYHIELDRHDIVLADGMACETYMDTGNRGPLYQEEGVRTPASKACAPLVTAGPRLAAIRRRLHRTALAAGFSLTYRPALRAIAGEATVLPEITMRHGRRIVRFALPDASRDVTLLSGSASPADTDPESEDRRELGVCLARAVAGAGGKPALGQGWLSRAATDKGVWMGRRSELVFAAPAETFTLTLAAIVQSWLPPVDLRGGRP
jgi:hypothetical protein